MERPGIERLEHRLQRLGFILVFAAKSIWVSTGAAELGQAALLLAEFKVLDNAIHMRTAFRAATLAGVLVLRARGVFKARPAWQAICSFLVEESPFHLRSLEFIRR